MGQGQRKEIRFFEKRRDLRLPHPWSDLDRCDTAVPMFVFAHAAHGASAAVSYDNYEYTWCVCHCLSSYSCFSCMCRKPPKTLYQILSTALRISFSLLPLW